MTLPWFFFFFPLSNLNELNLFLFGLFVFFALLEEGLFVFYSEFKLLSLNVILSINIAISISKTLLE